MIPIVDKPLIQYAVEEAIAAGITEIIFIIGRHKHVIEDHFDKAYELEAELKARGKMDTLKMLQNIQPKTVSFTSILQSEALGLGHAVLCAKPVVNDEPFAVLLPDDLIVSDRSVIQQMIELYEENQCSILAVQNVRLEDTMNYGIVKYDQGERGLHSILDLVEKPKPKYADSTLGIVGRYILTHNIFNYLEKTKPDSGGEIQLTDGISSQLKKERMLAYEFTGTRYDCGTKIGYLKATIELALKHPEVGIEFSNYLATKGYKISSD